MGSSVGTRVIVRDLYHLRVNYKRVTQFTHFVTYSDESRKGLKLSFLLD